MAHFERELSRTVYVVVNNVEVFKINSYPFRDALRNIKICVVKNITWFFLVNDQRNAQILFYVFISIYNVLHVSNTSCSLSGETNCINTASGNSHSMLVAEMCAGWKKTLLPTCTLHGHRQLPEAVLIQFISPDYEHDVLETYREL